MRLARVRKTANSPVVSRYKSYVLVSRGGLTGIKALRSLVVYTAAYKADRVVGEGLGRVEASLYQSSASSLLSTSLSNLLPISVGCSLLFSTSTRRY